MAHSLEQLRNRAIRTSFQFSSFQSFSFESFFKILSNVLHLHFASANKNLQLFPFKRWNCRGRTYGVSTHYHTTCVNKRQLGTSSHQVLKAISRFMGIMPFRIWIRQYHSPKLSRMTIIVANAASISGQSALATFALRRFSNLTSVLPLFTERLCPL